MNQEKTGTVGYGETTGRQAVQPAAPRQQQPTVGRIVMYTNLGDKDGRYPPEQQAAIVTKVHNGIGDYGTDAGPNLSLAIFYPTGLSFMADVPASEEYERGHWTWPVRIGG